MLAPALCRAPHGARGLKHCRIDFLARLECRAPHGARGLKHFSAGVVTRTVSRAPHEARGLKHLIRDRLRVGFVSHPTRGAWIETLCSYVMLQYNQVAPRMGRVD